ncbi:MAG: NlpC/P60 family protein [Limnobacter sp.]|uniref:NlpC/P60 family protein n=1 Tax=Limnobacter sp. TaxID=2003368 RepID=UPI00391AC8C7
MFTDKGAYSFNQFGASFFARILFAAVFTLSLQPAVANTGLSENAIVESRILAHYHDWSGTRHKLGGHSHSGVDCSYFIRSLFSAHFNLELPRTASAQQGEGTPVALSELQPGDLLFFRSGPTRHHVGVYLNDQQFVHVSSQLGVTSSNLNDRYWKSRFVTARRVKLKTPEDQAVLDTAPVVQASFSSLE